MHEAFLFTTWPLSHHFPAALAEWGWLSAPCLQLPRCWQKPFGVHLDVMVYKAISAGFILLKSNDCFACQSIPCPGSSATSRLKAEGKRQEHADPVPIPVSGDDTRHNSTRFIYKNCTAVYSTQEPGFVVPHLVVQGVVPATKLTTITHRPGRSAQTSKPPSLQPRAHSLGWLLSFLS